MYLNCKMNEIILNNYIKISLIAYDSFVAQDRGTYEAVGIVVGCDVAIKNIPIGAKVYFDSFMVKKYPVEGEEGKFECFVHYSEIVQVKYAHEAI